MTHTLFAYPGGEEEYPSGEALSFQRVFGSLPELYLVLSTDLYILAVNDAYLKATLTTRENIVGKHVFEAFPDNPDVPDANGVANLNSSLQQVLSTGQPHEMPVQQYDVPRPPELGGGFETRYWLPLNTPVLDEEGQVLYIVHQVTNVTEQVAERQKGDQNEVLLQGLAHTSPVALWMTDTVGAVTYVNQTWIDWTGREIEEHLGQGWALSILEEDREQAIGKLLGSARTRANYQADFRIIHADGTVHWCSAEGVPRYLSDGTFVGYVGSCSDITRRKLSEEQLQQVSAELTAANRELLFVNQQLSYTNADLDNFIYTASHDLKAPIANIEGLLHLITDDFSNGNFDLSNTQHVLSLMQRAVERFKKTIAHLTDVTRLQKEHAGDIAQVDISKMVHEVLLDMEQPIRISGAKVETDLNRCGAIAFSYKNLRSIVYNLISNAVKYRAPERPPLVRVSCHEEPAHMVLVVKDNGLGMSDKQQEQLFSMFRRFHDHVEGSGIGLFMVKRIVENAGGKIAVTSAIGEGTTFTIYLKRQEI
ncbi:PAS domain-containing sensor histidine kinase [Pontibacter diazotrophicus]|uniref:histidine kinase n=1 Tax=Pontibacter diazotrophicus TaxID=1400979 RepID=A0A3D8L299_9BACT|nr:PAS domain-containing sensor histidine kinase [Pontibacter diazotrophicus]RDV11486.1 PAS domain-containing sensor histidine kinase [Pontibacter diazotrophicus]